MKTGKRAALLLVFVLALGCAAPRSVPAPAEGGWKASRGAHAVTAVDVEWTDAARKSRVVPARVHAPPLAACPCPVIVFSPGLGGSREGYGYAAAHWASHGYVVAVLTHAGSDTAAVRESIGDASGGIRARVREGMFEVLGDPEVRRVRPGDVTFALDQLVADSRWKIDPKRAGMAGHSFGAWTTAVVMGATFDLGAEKALSMRDERFRSGIAMSPQSAKDGWAGFSSESWKPITAPMLYLTGTEDHEAGTKDASNRRDAFDHGAATRELVTITDAAHLAFSDSKRLGAASRDPRHHGWILQETTAFWDATLRDDPQAKAWLEAETLERVSAGEAVVERKP